jgi:hypothetical protein
VRHWRWPLPIEAKLLRFNRANGNVEPAAYGHIFSPLSDSLLGDAQKLAESGFEAKSGLLGIYYERGDEEAPVYDSERLAEKVVSEARYWFDIELDVVDVIRFDGLRHDVHRQGAILTWALR